MFFFTYSYLTTLSVNMEEVDKYVQNANFGVMIMPAFDTVSPLGANCVKLFCCWKCIAGMINCKNFKKGHSIPVSVTKMS